ncbi:acyl carrier protein [Streptomyces sp. NPDC045251]|uniref:acyl carrier protein n=1 Tax=unclassified Streptomyces TaxID=2593676 RepID=UPI003407842C
MNEVLKSILIDDLKLDEAAVRPENSLEEVGLDSLSVVELSVGLSERLGLEISEEELEGAATLSGIDQLIDRRRTAG